MVECGFDQETNPYIIHSDKEETRQRFKPTIAYNEIRCFLGNIESQMHIIMRDSVKYQLIVQVHSLLKTRARLKVFDMAGSLVRSINVTLTDGQNKIS